jgi:uncharacterized protein (UPF0548 family)
MDEALISALVDRAIEFGKGTEEFTEAVADLRAWREEAYAQLRAKGAESLFVTSVTLNGKTTSGVANMTCQQVLSATQQALNTLTGPNTRVTYVGFSRITER